MENQCGLHLAVRGGFVKTEQVLCSVLIVGSPINR
jgi:hypothetical protein